MLWFDAFPYSWLLGNGRLAINPIFRNSLAFRCCEPYKIAATALVPCLFLSARIDSVPYLCQYCQRPVPPSIDDGCKPICPSDCLPDVSSSQCKWVCVCVCPQS